MATLLNLFPLWLREWAKFYLLPLLKEGVRELLWPLLRGTVDTLLVFALPVTALMGSQALMQRRYTLTVNQQTAQLIEFPSGDRFMASGEGYSGDGDVRPVDSTSFSVTRNDC